MIEKTKTKTNKEVVPSWVLIWSLSVQFGRTVNELILCLSWTLFLSKAPPYINAMVLSYLITSFRGGVYKDDLFNAGSGSEFTVILSYSALIKGKPSRVTSRDYST